MKTEITRHLYSNSESDYTFNVNREKSHQETRGITDAIFSYCNHRLRLDSDLMSRCVFDTRYSQTRNNIVDSTVYAFEASTRVFNGTNLQLQKSLLFKIQAVALGSCYVGAGSTVGVCYTERKQIVENLL